ncbi:MAG TPA: SdrD B-like domain-containing protein, partial [Methanoregulaceae archaeon]|nr:SdrD B-like domain-containing protein [Methanoregulaceae archaeon]
MRKFVVICLIILIAVGMTVGIASAADIIGYKFFDYNKNGHKDGNGFYLENWDITLAWKNGTVIQTTQTDEFGQYGFTGVDPAYNYSVYETLEPGGWFNTSPSIYDVGFVSGWNETYGPNEIFTTEEELNIRMYNLPYATAYVWMGYNIRIGMSPNQEEFKMFEPLGDWSPGASSAALSNGNDTIWTNGVYKHFNETWTPGVTFNANMTLDTLTDQQDTSPTGIRSNSRPIRDIIIRLHSERTYWYVEVDNLTLKQGDVEYELVNSNMNWSGTTSSSGQDQYLLVRASNILSGLPGGSDIGSGGFSLDGDIKFYWSAGNPTGNVLKMDVYVGNYRSSYEDLATAIFGNHINGTVTGYKLDTTGTGLEDWNITLTNATLDFYGYNVTDTDGYYEIQYVPPGFFALNESLGDWPGWTPVVGNRTIQTNLTTLNLTNQNFTNTDQELNGSVSGFKINDLNVNGRWDPGEPTLPGWTITLSNQTEGYSNSSITNVTGYYLIEEVPLGIYWLNETLQSGWTQVTLNRTVQIGDGDLNLTNQNFTNAQSFRNITGYKFNDLNRNGIWDIGEPPIENWQVCVNYTNGTTIACDLTNASGYYEFADLSSFETYRVTEDLYTGWMNSTNRSANLSFICPDFPILPAPKSPGSSVNLNYTSGGTPIPAPPLPPVDYAYFRATPDINPGYDIFNGSEYPAWCVDAYTLIQASDYGACCFISSYDANNVSLLVTAYPNVGTTDWDRVNYILNRRHDPTVNYNYKVVQRTLWNFTNGLEINTSSYGGIQLNSGEVSLANTLRAETIANGLGYIPPCGGVMGVFVNLSAPSTLRQLTMMELPTLCCDTGYDFGNYQQNGSVSGYKFNESGTGLPGWTIELYNETLGTLVNTTTTGADGYYVFENVDEWGYYNITEIQETGYQVTDPASSWYSSIYINGEPVVQQYNFT